MRLYFYLMRFNKPIPLLLLLWPTLSALFIASQGHPSFKLIFIFTLGTFLMRAAGCIINDYADRNFDHQVERTQHRPLTTGVIKTRSALILFFVLCVAALGLVLCLNVFSMCLAVVGFFLTVLYPFTKRFFIAPQLFLGFTYSFGILMAFAAVSNHLPSIAWQFYGVTLLWVVMYDTEYALADRPDDLKLGIYSTAILFRKYDRLMIGFLQIVFVAWLAWIGQQLQFTLFYYLGLLCVAILFGYQHQLLLQKKSAAFIQAFLNNHWVGLVIFVGVVLNYLEL